MVVRPLLHLELVIVLAIMEAEILGEEILEEEMIEKYIMIIT